ncbi:hypothetical protein ACJJTC_004482 [Scirpophaga incertulas]
MQETVGNTNERKSLLSSFLDVLETREKQLQADRQLQEEKYVQRTRKIYDFHERQQREVLELRRCLDYVSQHAHVLETVLRGGNGSGDAVPLGAALVRQAAPLQRSMAQCVANAARIRRLLAATHQPQMDNMLAKMEAELNMWTSFVQRAVDATYSTEVFMDNLHNMIAQQQRCVREVSSSTLFASLCAGDIEAGSGEAAGGAGPGDDGTLVADRNEDLSASPPHRRAPSAACSTPIARD